MKSNYSGRLPFEADLNLLDYSFSHFDFIARAYALPRYYSVYSWILLSTALRAVFYNFH